MARFTYSETLPAYEACVPSSIQTTLPSYTTPAIVSTVSIASTPASPGSQGQSLLAALCRWFPGSILERRVAQLKEKEMQRIREEKERISRMTKAERAEHDREVAEILERDRILGENLKMMGL